MRWNRKKDPQIRTCLADAIHPNLSARRFRLVESRNGNKTRLSRFVIRFVEKKAEKVS